MEKVKIVEQEVKTETSDMDNNSHLVNATTGFVPLRAIHDPDFETDVTTECHDNVEKCIAVAEGRVWTVKPKTGNLKQEVPEEVKLER